MHIEAPPSSSGAGTCIDPKALKAFRPAGRGPWHDVPDHDWNDWRWQLKHRLGTVEQLERHLPGLTRSERAGAILAGQSNMEGHAKTETFDYIGDDPATAPLLKQMRDEEGKPILDSEGPGLLLRDVTGSMVTGCLIRDSRTDRTPAPSLRIEGGKDNMITNVESFNNYTARRVAEVNWAIGYVCALKDLFCEEEEKP